MSDTCIALNLERSLCSVKIGCRRCSADELQDDRAQCHIGMSGLMPSVEF